MTVHISNNLDGAAYENAHSMSIAGKDNDITEDDLMQFAKQKAPGTLSSEVNAASGEVTRQFDINPYSYALNTSRALDPTVDYTANYAPFNILHELDNNYMDLNVADVKFQGEIKWKALPELELSALGAVRYQASSQEHLI